MLGVYGIGSESVLAIALTKLRKLAEVDPSAGHCDATNGAMVSDPCRSVKIRAKLVARMKPSGIRESYLSRRGSPRIALRFIRASAAKFMDEC